jgi:hypothetical protein
VLGRKKERRERPPQAIEEARHQPNGWVYEIVGGEVEDGSVPPERIRGAWKVDGEGQITGEYQANPNFVAP